MKRGRLHPVIAWLVLIWFGLTNTGFAGVVVVCRDAHGGLRIEWGCGQNSSGECRTSCGGSADTDDPGAPHPCQDSSTASDQQTVKAPPRSSFDEIASVEVCDNLTGRALDALCPPRWVYGGGEPRPPDPLAHMRTVIILV